MLAGFILSVMKAECDGRLRSEYRLGRYTGAALLVDTVDTHNMVDTVNIDLVDTVNTH